MASEKRIGLALGGGGARGMSHILVLEAFDDLGVRPSVIAGTSIGAIIGAGYAAGMTGREMRERAIAFFSNRREVLSRLWKIRPLAFSDVLRGRLTAAQFDAEQALEYFVPGMEVIPQTFEELEIPLKVVASDFYGWSETVIAEGRLRPAIAASIAIPSVFKPVKIHDRIQVDGGAFNPLPFDHVNDADLVVACDVAGGPTGDPDRMPNLLETIVGASQVSMQAITAEKLKWHRPDILVRPDIAGVFVLDFLKTSTILSNNVQMKDDLKRRLEHAIHSPLEELSDFSDLPAYRRFLKKFRNRSEEALSAMPE